MAKPAKNGKSSKGKVSRRSRGESSTGAKENSVEMRKGPDLNLPEPVILKSDDFQMHYRAIKAATEKKDTANNLLRGCYKQAKKVHPQLAEAVRTAITIERADDPEAVRAHLDMYGFVLKETGHHIQLTIHDQLGGDVNEQAKKRGFADGSAGRMSNCSYPEGSDLAKLYNAGWLEGQAKLIGGDLPLDADTAGEGHNVGEFDEQEGDEPGEFEGADEVERREQLETVN